MKKGSLLDLEYEIPARELKALVADRERLEWLIEHADRAWWTPYRKISSTYWCWWDGMSGNGSYSTAREAIDAAMAHEKETQNSG